MSYFKVDIPGKDCKICHGYSKDACFMCGNKKKKKKDMTDDEILVYDAWIERIEYLRKTYHKLRKFRMATTQEPGLDEAVREYIGDWTFDFTFKELIVSKTIEYNGQKLYIKEAKYQDGGRLCLQLVTASKEPYAILTVNLPGQHLEEGEFFVKNYSENVDLAEAAMKTGIFVDTGKKVRSGYVEIPIWRFKA